MLRLQLPHHFSLAHAVCSYGYFVLAPNYWQPSTSDDPNRGRLHRMLCVADVTIPVVIRQSRSGSELIIDCQGTVPRKLHRGIKAQVSRMLHLDECFDAWRSIHPQAWAANFTRIFRSPTLFEDMIKTITSCNVSWPNTIRMNRQLCREYGSGGSFPGPIDLASEETEKLKNRVSVGYRAERIIRLARDIVEGRIDLSWYESTDRCSEELYDSLRGIYGFGDYAASNVLQLLGRYDRLPIDSEVIRHFKTHHPKYANKPTKQIAEAATKFYGRYDPYQFMAYWFDLWQDAEHNNGPAYNWPLKRPEHYSPPRSIQ